MPNETDINSEYIKNIILDYRLSYHSISPRSTYDSYIACKNLAIALKETEYEKELDAIINGTKTNGIKIAYIQHYLFPITRQIRRQKPRKKVNGKVYGDPLFTDLLLQARLEISIIFNKIQAKYNISENTDWISQTAQNSRVNFNELGI